jgi:hypothetical protein
VLRTNSHGSITVKFSLGTKTNIVELCDVNNAPDVLNNLISVGCLTDKENMATFTGTGVEFKTQARVSFAQGQKSGCLWWVSIVTSEFQGQAFNYQDSIFMLVIHMYINTTITLTQHIT